MATYRIIYEREGCIGAASCVAACSGNWVLAKDGKADFKKEIIEEHELQANKDAAESCPVMVIHIEEVETGKRII